ncbi:hypothetical protein M885DRAFT_506458 [Pelagophyceae sp. CCMP2097]|nr:hypothetical protein M885DRAFT_506458 [Pelagophyceae sp. CCMP2097]
MPLRRHASATVVPDSDDDMWIARDEGCPAPEAAPSRKRAADRLEPAVPPDDRLEPAASKRRTRSSGAACASGEHPAAYVYESSVEEEDGNESYVEDDGASSAQDEAEDDDDGDVEPRDEPLGAYGAEEQRAEGAAAPRKRRRHSRAAHGAASETEAGSSGGRSKDEAVERPRGLLRRHTAATPAASERSRSDADESGGSDADESGGPPCAAGSDSDESGGSGEPAAPRRSPRRVPATITVVSGPPRRNVDKSGGSDADESGGPPCAAGGDSDESGGNGEPAAPRRSPRRVPATITVVSGPPRRNVDKSGGSDADESDESDSDESGGSGEPAAPRRSSRLVPAESLGALDVTTALDVTKQFARGSRVSYVCDDDEECNATVTRVTLFGALVLDFDDGTSVAVDLCDVEARVRAPSGEPPPAVESENLCRVCGAACSVCFGGQNTARRKWMWYCQEHGFQAWDGLNAAHTSAGPPCACGVASTRRGDDWGCAKTSGRRCDFRCNVDAAAPAETPPRRQNEDGEDEFRVSEPTRRALDRLFKVPAEDASWLGVGRDVCASLPRGYYDSLEVVGAWHVKHASRKRRYESALEAAALTAPARTPLRPAHEEAVQDLVRCGMAPPSASANEAILLHGTTPGAVSRILRHNLDPLKARAGFFGAGTYLAEHPSKMDQYLCCHEAALRHADLGSTSRNKLYPSESDVPRGQVSYALVCRVVLGNAVETRDGVHDVVDGEDVFVGAPHGMHALRTLRRVGAHAVVASAGADCKGKRLREFVILDPKAIDFEYVVCLRRAKSKCQCGDLLRHRDVDEPAAPGGVRPMIACANSSKEGVAWTGGCGLFAKLPRCYCPKLGTRVSPLWEDGDFWSAEAEAPTNRYVCKQGVCGFQEVLDPAVEATPRRRRGDDNADDAGLGDFIDDDADDLTGDGADANGDTSDSSPGESDAESDA